jgi:serine protease
VWRRALTALCLAAAVAPTAHNAQAQSVTAVTQQLIVKFRDTRDKQALSAKMRVAILSADTSVAMTHLRSMAMDAEVVSLPKPVSLAEAQALALTIALRPEVEYAEPDRWVKPALNPNDALVGAQTYLNNEPGGISAFDAWDVTTGHSGSVVAVVDTGYRPHAGLAGRFLPGYDFLSDAFVANDGGGRDADALDPGDWVSKADTDGPLQGKNCDVKNSSWHGTAVASIIGANSNDGNWTAGIDWRTKILPVRVLGKCGGPTSDIVDGIAWAGGLPVPGVPLNPTPAQVINLSLGDTNPGACSTSEQSAISAVLTHGITRAVVASAGNDAEDVSQHAPANCAGVIAVGATTTRGGRTSYSNYGATVTISAPGGNYDPARGYDGIEVLIDSGATGPVSDSSGIANGTSFAAPMVSGVVSLMLGLAPQLTAAQVRGILTSTAKHFPDGTNCTPALCGVGILNAKAAVIAAAAFVPTNYGGLWWNAPPGSEAGWGVSVAHQGDTIFATWFTYDAAGKAWWLSMTAPKVADRTYAGTLNATRGPAFSASPFDPNAVSVSPVGSATLTFDDVDNGSFAYTVNEVTQTKSITKQVFATAPTCTFGTQPTLAQATNYQDLWWKAPAGSEAGWGLSLTHQSDTIFAVWFSYDATHAPAWVFATTLRSADSNSYAGTIYRATGPPFNAMPFDSSRIASAVAGSVVLTFIDGNNATFAYTLDDISQAKAITRQVFAAPGTTCQ